MVDINQHVEALHISITTGNDGVREGSNVYGIIVFREGDQVHTCGKSLNSGENWSNGSTHEAYIQIPHVKVKDIDGFRILFESKSCRLCTQDNWSMDKIMITYKLDNGQDVILLQQTGTPLYLFTSSSPEWEVCFHWD
jgi:hypothetical protein